MNKKGVILGMFVISIIVVIVASMSSSSNETFDVDMTRTHGSISTALGSPILGDPLAPITIVEFGDYQCHQCYNWFHDTKPMITRDYIETGKANLVFVDLAFLGRDSPKAAQATYCADDQNMYWEYHNSLYTFQESKIDNGWASSERLKSFAFNLNLDMTLFDECLDSEKHSKRVQYNSQQARDNGVRGTPGFFIVGPDGQEQLAGAQPFSVFKRILDTMV
ncbi:MAG: protein-disulfide isomerase [Nitrosopumilus sp. BACL13 MAG-121220-bin23]|jgi:protein-disulfide isomerase|nr:MAG: protein-disulfide isomerase [Nitrosopumilus sp. BACL13 MAG-121220-bin23]KRO31767.1 MAG: protein-disulfide isomerase [Nitrosopumilus sp. BACL13 MAG-120910-bin56]HIH99589.1 DsbA family protein [Nitrosopumilus sp.]